MFICICNGLTERRIAAAVEQGARSHEEVYEKCECVAQCYACAKEIDQIVERVTKTRLSEARPSLIEGSSPGRST